MSVAFGQCRAAAPAAYRAEFGPQQAAAAANAADFVVRMLWDGGLVDTTDSAPPGPG